MKGIFSLRTPVDLLGKLERDYQRLQAAPADSDLAFNFFVTAWHLLEWQYQDERERNAVRDAHQVLLVCEHLAVGAKHFRPTKPRHKSVSDTQRKGVWAEGFWAPHFWAPGTWGESLVVHLDGPARDKFGERIGVPDLAALVMKYWREDSGLRQSE